MLLFGFKLIMETSLKKSLTSHLKTLIWKCVEMIIIKTLFFLKMELEFIFKKVHPD